ncbi:MAG: alanine racemase [Flavobacteriaceae bacterium]|nr:alanine racemase [Flavobacteriaceae bacterium]
MITKPTLLLDSNKCRKNIGKMAMKAGVKGLIFRPHFKTHQSLKIGQWFRDFGVTKITVSSLSMASYFSSEWNDITVAFPVNILETETINELASKITLNIQVESAESAAYLAANLSTGVGCFIKIDVGTHRTGVDPNDIQKIEAIMQEIDNSRHMTFRGFLAHSGHTYGCTSKKEVINIHEKTLRIMVNLKQKFKNRYPDLILSVGDTPSCSLADNFEGLDEMRPGNFVFYDLTQEKIGSNQIDEIAVAMACPVVAKHRERNELVIYGGAVHFSKEGLKTEIMKDLSMEK